MKPSAVVDTRVIYCGDNLEQLAKLPEHCVDLIYIDPPFNSNRNYEVFWGETKEKRALRGPPRQHRGVHRVHDRHRSRGAPSPGLPSLEADMPRTATKPQKKDTPYAVAPRVVQEWFEELCGSSDVSGTSQTDRDAQRTGKAEHEVSQANASNRSQKSGDRQYASIRYNARRKRTGVRPARPEWSASRARMPVHYFIVRRDEGTGHTAAPALCRPSAIAPVGGGRNTSHE